MSIELRKEHVENIVALHGFCRDNGFEVSAIELCDKEGEYRAYNGDCMVSIKLYQGKFYAVGYCCSCMEMVEIEIAAIEMDKLIDSFVYHCKWKQPNPDSFSTGFGCIISK